MGSGDRIRKPKRASKTASYRVVLRIDVEEDDVLRSRGQETLKELKESDQDYLRDHVEHEIGWLEQSFSGVEIKSIKPLVISRQLPKMSKPARKSKR
jgi:hypothetical protein